MLSVAILAAGKGTRMESSLPKVLHKISGKSILQRVIDSCVELKPDQIFVITGHKSKEVQKSIPNEKKNSYCYSRTSIRNRSCYPGTFWRSKKT